MNSSRRVFTLTAVPETEAAKMGVVAERSTRIVRVGDAKANYAAKERELAKLREADARHHAGTIRV